MSTSDKNFENRPVSEWTDQDFTEFVQHIHDDRKLPERRAVQAQGRTFGRGRVKSVFDAGSFRGVPGSPFDWYRGVEGRLEMADSVSADLARLAECDGAGRLRGLSTDARKSLFDAMAARMALVRYGQTAADSPARASDYKTQMALAMDYGGVDMVKDDVSDWKAHMSELVAAERDKSSKPGARYVCKFFNRTTPSVDFNSVNACAFYDSDFLEAYVQDFVADACAVGPAVGKPMPVRDMYKFTTAPDDYDLKYKITKAAAIAQGTRVMPKEDWVNNYRSQAAFVDMRDSGFGGKAWMASEAEAAAAPEGESWTAESEARMRRADRLYDELEVLAGLPLDRHGSLKYQPSNAVCARCGWGPGGGEGPDGKSASQKYRENAFNRDLILRVADVIYGPDVAKAMKTDMRAATKLPPVHGESKNDVQKAWDMLRSGDFRGVQDMVVDWSGRRLEVLEAEREASGGPYPGTYRGRSCVLRSPEAVAACAADLQATALVYPGSSDGLSLPQEDMDLMYRVYAACAETRGEPVSGFEEWRGAVAGNPGLDLSRGEFDYKAPETARPAPVVQSKPKTEEELRAEAAAAAERDFLDQAGHPADAAEYAGGTGEAEVTATGEPDDTPVPEDFLAQLPACPGDVYARPRDTRDLDAEAAAIGDAVEPVPAVPEYA